MLFRVIKTEPMKRAWWPFWLWLLCVFLILVWGRPLVRHEFERSLGESMMALAAGTARQLALGREQVAELLPLDYAALRQHPLNREFERDARELMALADIRYIYVEVDLGPAVPFRVEPGEEKVFNAAAGTPLDILYLLDAVTEEEAARQERPFPEKERYGLLGERNRVLFAGRQPGWLVSEDRWGKYLTAYAPLYLSDGDFLGMLGVDYDYGSYRRALLLYESVLLLPLLLSGGVLLFQLFQLKSSIRAEKQARGEALQAYRDTLTGIWNRRGIWRLLERQWRLARAHHHGVTLLLVDVDYFKEYNDNYGHPAGDRMLRAVAGMLAELAGEYQGVVGRYGGDEFMLLFANLIPGEEHKLGQEILARCHTLAIPHAFSPISDRQTLSVGAVTLAPGQEVAMDTLVELADRALYQAKRHGRNRACCHQEPKRRAG